MHSEQPPPLGKFIVTTATKAQILERLNDFWSMKSTLMQVKRNPKFIDSPEFIKQAMYYYSTNSKLMEQHFWKQLKEDAQIRLLQSLILQEIDEINNLRMATSKNRGAIYIILSGTAEVKRDTEQEEELIGPGGVFGAVDLCNKIVDNIEEYRKMDDNELLDNHILTIKMHKGSYVRIGINDLFRNVFPVDNTEAIKKARAEDSAIAEIPWEDLTEDDKFYIKVYKRTRDMIHKDLFAFLDSYRTIPKNARMPAFKYYFEREKDREIILNEADPMHVYVIIDGRVRIEVEAKQNSDHTRHTLSCKRKGRRPMIVKTNVMPILLLDSGACVLLRRETFHLGDAINPPKATNNTHEQSTTAPYDPHNSRVLSSDGSVLGSIKTANHSFATGQSRLTTPGALHGSLHSNTTKVHSTNNTTKEKAFSPDDVFQLRMVFETYTTYLKIPYYPLDRVLLDEQLILREMANAIRDQLNFSNKAVSFRLRKLIPWLIGDKQFALPTKNPPPPEVKELENSLLNKLLEQDKNLFSATVGSFPKFGDGRATDDSTAATSDMTATLDDSLSTASSQKSLSSRSPKKSSKLKDMIESIKMQQSGKFTKTM